MGFKLLKKASGTGEALVLESILKAEGVIYRIEQESIGRLNAITWDGLGEIKIFVDEDDFEKAKEILDTKEEKD